MFKQINNYLDTMTVNMTVAKKDGKIIVSVIPNMFSMENEVNKSIPPFIVSGTADELDTKFAEAFEQAAIHLTKMDSELNTWKKQADDAKLKSTAAKTITDEKNKKDAASKKDAAEKVKKGDEFFNKKEYDRAVAYYKSALSVTPTDASILTKCNKAESLSGSIGMFSAVEDIVTVPEEFEEVPFDEEDDDKMFDNEDNTNN